MLKTFESEVAEMKLAILSALRAGDDLRPEVFAAAAADLIGAVCADLTVTGRDGTITLDERINLFLDRTRAAYRRRLTTVTIGKSFVKNGGAQ